MNNTLVWIVLVGFLAGSTGARDASAQDASQSPHHRLAWRHAEQLCQYVDKGEDTWVELDKDGGVFLQFKETRRNCDFVELQDPSRGYTFRFYKDALLIQGGNKGFQRFEEFTKYYSGEWVR
jgi:hypothetical protein